MALSSSYCHPPVPHTHTHVHTYSCTHTHAHTHVHSFPKPAGILEKTTFQTMRPGGRRTKGPLSNRSRERCGWTHNLPPCGRFRGVAGTVALSGTHHQKCRGRNSAPRGKEGSGQPHSPLGTVLRGCRESPHPGVPWSQTVPRISRVQSMRLSRDENGVLTKSAIYD